MGEFMPPLTLLKRALLLSVVLAGPSMPATSEAGIIPWTYNAIFGYGPIFGGGYYGGYGYGAAPYYNAGYPSTIGYPASPGTISSYYAPWNMGYGGYAYSAGYGPACGCNPCGCDPCGSGCNACGTGDCATGNCPGGNCATGNCGATYSPSTTPVPDPNLSKPRQEEEITPRQSPPRTYDNNPPGDQFNRVPTYDPQQNWRGNGAGNTNPDNNARPFTPLAPDNQRSTNPMEPNDLRRFDPPVAPVNPMNNAPVNPINPINPMGNPPANPNAPAGNLLPDEEINPFNSPAKPSTEVQPLELDSAPIASLKAPRERLVTQASFRAPSVVRLPVAPRPDQQQTQVAQH
ncbi:hypothetical protein [Planctomicrobium sp. SH664]|uniref:hypothetical protein n=1 Tax=Planctomicrobium sp. SH664 TaxID=3448125 RepID=UPI003F5CB71A